MTKDKNLRICWKKSPDLKRRIRKIAERIKLDWPKGNYIYCVSSTNANTRAYARIWGLSRIWQETLDLKPSYIIEVVSEKFDKLSEKQQDNILLHELAHIPNNFSGSLVPHIRRGKRNFKDRVNKLISKYSRKLI